MYISQVEVLYELFDADSDGALGIDELQTSSALASAARTQPYVANSNLYNE